MAESSYVCPCGIYPKICPIYVADKGNHARLKEIIAGVNNVGSDDIACDGCISEKPFVNCQTCAIKSCVLTKGIEGCYQCEVFPCKAIEDKDAITRSVILRAIPALKQLGAEKFVEAEMKHYQCPHCGYQLFMGAQRCRNCKNPVNLD